MSSSASSFQFLEQSSLQNGDLPAIINDEMMLTFRDLHLQCQSLQAKLSSFGLEEGMVVGLLCANNASFVMGLFSILGTGSVVLPIYASLKEEERKKQYRESEMSFILGEKSLCKNEIIEFDAIAEFENLVLIRLSTSKTRLLHHISSPACIRFSSGTTGRHKGVVLSHTSVEQRTRAVFDMLGLKAGDRVLWVLPMAYHYIATLITFVRYGITLVISPAMFAREILETANRHAATLLYASPMHIRLLAAEPGNLKFDTLNQVISTSSGIDQHSCEQFASRMGLLPRQAYGIIEVGLPLVNKEENLSRAYLLGKPCAGYQVAILDGQGNELEPGKLGRLAMKGPGMFDGYMSPPQVSKDVLINGWFDTGDQAIRHTDGNVELKGREKAVINVGGNKVFPEEVEAVAESMPGLYEALVYGEQHILTGEMVVMDLVLNENSTLKELEILNFLRQRLTSYKVPRKIRFVEALERTNTGKKKRTGTGSGRE